MKSRYCVVFLMFVLIQARLATANSIDVPNHSFENPVTTHIIGFQSWTRIGGNGANPGEYNPYEYFQPGSNTYYVGANPSTDPAKGGLGYPGIDGENLAFAFETPTGSGFQQTLNAVFTADTSYTLTVAEGRRDGSQAAPTLGSMIELLAGNTVVASSIDNSGPAPGTFADQTAYLARSDSFSSLYGEALTIRVVTTLPFTTQYQATDWDNVRLESVGPADTVPEPTTFALLFFGSLTMFAYRLQRRTFTVEAR